MKSKGVQVHCKRLNGKRASIILDVLDNLHHRQGDLTIPKSLQTFEQQHPMLV